MSDVREKHVFSVIAPKGGRRRGGVRWAEGHTLVEAESMPTELLVALSEDPEITVMAGEVFDEPADDETDLPDLVRAAIAAMGPEQFGNDGSPKLGAIRAGFGKAEAKQITAQLRDEVWAAMKADGFEVGTNEKDEPDNPGEDVNEG